MFQKPAFQTEIKYLPFSNGAKQQYREICDICYNIFEFRALKNGPMKALHIKTKLKNESDKQKSKMKKNLVIRQQCNTRSTIKPSKDRDI